jgi:hypothetical protein
MTFLQTVALVFIIMCGVALLPLLIFIIAVLFGMFVGAIKRIIGKSEGE